MRNTGKPSEDQFKDIIESLRKKGYAHRLSDASDAFGRNKKLVNVARQPGDFFVVENGETYLADVKSTSHETSFPFSLIKREQLAAARMIVAAGGRYFFMVHHLPTNEWFKLPAAAVVNSPKKSLKWSELGPYRWSLADVYRRDGRPGDDRDAA